MQLNDRDTAELDKRGISEKQALNQLDRLSRGFSAIEPDRPATLNDGILKFPEAVLNELLEEFESEAGKLDMLKFVPASGAASRMFKALYADTPENASLRQQFIENIHRFPFYPALCEHLKQKDIGVADLFNHDQQRLFDFILNTDGLGFGHLPKGMVPFHRYPGGSRTAFQEHLYEGAHHAVGKDRKLRIHFTVQAGWEQEVKKHLLPSAKLVKEKFDLNEIELSYSVQSPSTDTLALAENSEPLRDDSGALVFRPGGHGALIHNLDNVQADFIFIKNIDNVVADDHKYQSLLYKKVLCGLAIQLRRSMFKFCKAIDQQRVPGPLRREMEQFIQHWLQIDIPEYLTARAQKQAFLEWVYPLFDRPLRVCGMVKNEGEPGGGPFWVKEHDGQSRLQIVEKSQINLDDPKQAEILNRSTHFNPVDLVCSTRNYRGESYELLDFVDPETGFISQKSHNGQPIKALELPGLWNGAMAHWNTIFVEVPAATFSPVKTVNDLLKPLHQ